MKDEISDGCKPSKLSFTLTGNGSNVPMMFLLDGNPSGAKANISVEGNGSIVKQSDGSSLYSVDQNTIGDSLLTEIPIFVTVNGVIKVEITLDSSNFVMHNGDMCIGQCGEFGLGSRYQTKALVELRSALMDNVYLQNEKIIYV